MEYKENIVIFNKKEMEILAKGLMLLIKDNTRLADFKEVFNLLNKVNSQLENKILNDEKEKNSGYIYVKYEDEHWPRTFGGKEYSYYTDLQLEVGDLVEAPTKYGTSIAKVTRINIPEEEIKDIIPYIKNITKKINKERFIYYSEIVEDAA